MTAYDTPRCLDARSSSHIECEGEVSYHMQPYPSTRSFPRCEKHWDERCRKQDEIDRRYAPNSSVPPAGFDPTYAGERWEDDY